MVTFALQGRIAVLGVLFLAACAGPPPFGPMDAAAEQAPYPELLPFEEAVAAATVTIDDPTAEIAARAAALRARAAALRAREI